MSEHATPTLEPKQQAKLDTAPAYHDREALFDSIVRERESQDENVASGWGAAFTGLLWVGYAIAIVVAIALVWSAAKELLQ